LPLGATCGEDWIDFDLETSLNSAQFLDAMVPQTLSGLEWRRAIPLRGDERGLQDLLQYAEWSFQPYQPDQARGLVEQLLERSTGEQLLFKKRSKRGKIREIDARPKIRQIELDGRGLRVVLGASPAAPEGALGLFDYLRACLPDLEEHPMTVFKIDRVRFLRQLEGELVAAVQVPDQEG
jgi:hypothetical protein